jgi:cleavage stimulation factor subunit 3
MDKSYEFALLACGHDRNAGEIWADFINFVKGWDNSTKDSMPIQINRLRTIYQRAISIPLENVEQLWRDYDAYENGINKQMVRQL